MLIVGVVWFGVNNMVYFLLFSIFNIIFIYIHTFKLHLSLLFICMYYIYVYIGTFFKKNIYNKVICADILKIIHEYLF